MIAKTTVLFNCVHIQNKSIHKILRLIVLRDFKNLQVKPSGPRLLFLTFTLKRQELHVPLLDFFKQSDSFLYSFEKL